MSETKFKFDYIKNRKIYFIISGIIVIFSILSTFIFSAKSFSVNNFICKFQNVHFIYLFF